MTLKPIVQTKDEWENFEVVVSMEANVRLEDGKLVQETKMGYLPLDQADCYQREQDAFGHLFSAWEVLIELDKIKRLSENGVKLKLDLDLHGLSWGWEGRQEMKSRYETKKERCKI